MRGKALSILPGAALLFCGLDGRAADGIDEIIVVAQKRSEPLHEVPAAVSVATGARLERDSIDDLFELAREVSSLTVTQTTGPINTSFRLRRIGNEANIPNFEPAVGLFVDGAFRSRSGLATGDLFDIERIEVLKGPQTSLYGRNTTAGVVSILTKAPTGMFEAAGRVSVGRIDGYDAAARLRANASMSGPLMEGLSARVSVAWFEHDHTMKNLFVPDDSQDMNRHSFRGQLLYSPSDSLDARLILGSFVVDSANTAEFEIDEGIAIASTNAAFGVPCPASTSTDRAFCNNRAVVTDLDADDATLLIDITLNDVTLSSVSGYERYDSLRDFDADQLNINLVDIFDRSEGESWSQELRLVSPRSDTLEWLGGIYYYHNEFSRGDPALPTIVLGNDAPRVRLPSGLPLGQPGDAGIMTSVSETEHVSVFGHLSWRATAKLELSAGARWQTEDKSSVIVNTANHSTPTLITLVLAPPDASADLSRDAEGFSWNLSGRYEWSDTWMTYLSAARGFKSGGFNAGFSPTPGTGREFDDATVVSYELGTKALLAGNRVRLNAALFHADYDDFQSAGFVSLRFRVNNAEKVSVSGFEFDVQALLGNSLTATASISYADAKYDRYTNGACYYNRPPDNANGTGCVLSGSSLYLAPKWKAWLNLDYERPVTVGTFHAGADWSWTDRHYTNATLDPRHVRGPYSLFNLRAGLRIGRYDVFAWIDNIRDEIVVMQDGPTNLFGSDPAFARFLDAPRAFGVTLTMHW